MTLFETQFAKALKAGQNRDYKKSIAILEDLAAQGLADGSSKTDSHPEIFLFLARSWHAESMYSRSAVCARSYIKLRPEDGSGWFFLGRACFADGAYDRAVSALKRSVELNPQSIDARTLLGMALLKWKKPVLARSVFEEALSIAPDDPKLNQGYLNALFVEAVRTYKRGNAEAARQRLTFLINNDIDGVVPRLYLAHALRELKFLPEALSQYEAAIQFAPEDSALQWYPVAVLLDMGETEQAAKIMTSLGEAPQNGQPTDKMVNLLIVKNHLEKEEWGSAAQAARSWLKLYGSDAQLHALMGEAQRNLGNRTESMNHFNRAIELDRQNPAPWYGILMLLVEERDWANLAPLLEKAERSGCDADTISYYRVLCAANLDEDPSEILSGIQQQIHIHGAVPEMVVALARTYFRLGLTDLAIGWYRKAVELESDSEVAWLGLIACCEELDPGDALKSAYEEYLGRWTDNAAIRRDFTQYLAGRELFAEAADQLEALSRFAPTAQNTHQLALFRRKAGQYRSAAILYRSLLREKPADRMLLANLVFCLDRMGEAASALALMHEANRAFKPDADALLIEGRLLARSGDFNGALEIFRKSIDRFPKDARGWEEIAGVYAKQGVSEMAATFSEKARDLKESGKVREN